MKDFSLHKKETDPNFALLVQLWPLVFLWRWPKSKKIRSSGEKFRLLGFPIISKSKLYLLSPFQENHDSVWNIWAILARRKDRVTNQRVRIKIWQNFCKFIKIFCLQHFPVLQLYITKDISEKIWLDFKVWLLFLVLCQQFWKIMS